MKEIDLIPYVVAARLAAADLRKTLADKEFRHLREQYGSIGSDAVFAFRNEHAALVHELLSAPADARSYRLSRLSTPMCFWATVTLVQMLSEAAAVLEAAEMWILPGTSLHEMPMNVHRVLDAPLLDPGYIWPLPDCPASDGTPSGDKSD